MPPENGLNAERSGAIFFPREDHAQTDNEMVRLSMTDETVDLEIFAIDEQIFAQDGAWPSLNKGPSLDGFIAEKEEDFFVEEIPAYAPDGSGDHLFIHIEKRGISTLEAVKRLGLVSGLSSRDIGFAGRKDARGLCRQYLSIPRSAEARLADFADENIQILETQAHHNKLRMGHLRGNRFVLNIQRENKDLDEMQLKSRRDLIDARLHLLQGTGLPNYYGVQRFGHDFLSARRGAALLLGLHRVRGRRKADFLISALQSMLFNDYLAERLQRSLLKQALNGDVLQTERGGLFNCEDVEVDNQRLSAGELRVSGPMYGKKMRASFDASLTLESEILENRNLSMASFERYRPVISGSRRALTVDMQDLNVEHSSAGEQLAFVLPSGSYATVLLREIYLNTIT